MKKFFITISLASVGMFTSVSTVFAVEYDPPIVSNALCLIDAISVPALNATKEYARGSFEISFPASAIHCPDGISISNRNFIERNDGSALENGEWGLVHPNFGSDGEYQLSRYISVGLSKWPVDPYSELSSWNYNWIGYNTHYFQFSNDSSDLFKGDFSDSDFINGGYLNVVSEKDISNYGSLVYRQDDIITRYPLRFISDITIKYESTVLVSAKVSPRTITIAAKTSRNRPTQLASFHMAPQGKLLFSYPGDVATLYRDGQKVAVAKIARNGKVKFKVKKTKKAHTYEVRIAENAINFAGSGSVVK